MEADDLLCSRNARSRTPLVGRAQSETSRAPCLRESWRERNAHAYLQREVKVEAQVEQRSIQPGVFVTLNLDLSLDLPMGYPQSESASAPSLLKA
jgi:hypothetical protein